MPHSLSRFDVPSSVVLLLCWCPAPTYPPLRVLVGTVREQPSYFTSSLRTASRATPSPPWCRPPPRPPLRPHYPPGTMSPYTRAVVPALVLIETRVSLGVARVAYHAALPHVQRPRPREEGRGAGGVYGGHRGVPDGHLGAGAGQMDQREASQDWDEVARPVDEGVGAAGAKCSRKAKQNVATTPEDVYGQPDSSFQFPTTGIHSTNGSSCDRLYSQHPILHRSHIRRTFP
uniref:Uncharacterized protein n=1 Tax=Mycena chlorophos TaxID=658473 RepID=A0ABQ0LKT0_MYCCL|nr:predicted protein [Mycena chlorophos]